MPAPFLQAAFRGRVDGWTSAADAALLELLSVRETPEAQKQMLWKLFVPRWQGRLFAFAKSITRDSLLAEEAVQDTFVDLWHAVTRKNIAIENLQGWLFKLTGRKAIKLMREKHHPKNSRVERLHDNAVADHAGENGQNDIREVLSRLVETLPDRLRIPVLMHFASGLVQTEVARAMGCKQSTISERIGEALEKLKQGLD